MNLFSAHARGYIALRATVAISAVFLINCESARESSYAGDSSADASIGSSKTALTGGDSCTVATYDGHSYWFCSQALRSWLDASTKCTAVGAKLVRIDHPGENEFVEHNLRGDSWTGANDRTNEKRWVWQNGGDQFSTGPNRIPSYFTNWQSGEPNDQFLSEDCGLIKTSGVWNDVNCLLPKGYVCESGPDLCTASLPKTQPGECGCATPDSDSDQDGVSNCLDQCPNDVSTATLDACGCPSSPKPVGTACSDGLCAANTQCNALGVCGQPQQCGASANCTYETRGHSEYLFCHELKTMQQARDRCIALGMDALSIESKDEDSYLYNRGHLFGVHWLGSAGDSSGTWKWLAKDEPFWTSNAAVNGKYTNWLPTQPGLGLGRCAIRDDLTGKWTTAPCNGVAGYICELSDRCPTDPNKRLPGVCGCGRADADSDGDGVMDCDALTKLNDEPGVDSCLLTIGARPQLDTSMAAASFMSKTKTFAEYLALSRDRSDKLDLIFGDLALCKGIQAGDRDGDLVPDSIDQCPNTPPLTPTDQIGCTDPLLPDAPADDAVREGVNDTQIAAAKPGTCDTTRSNLTPEVLSGFINNSQLQPAAATVFLNFIPRGCDVRIRVEAMTTNPAGWPYGGGKTLYFETGTNDLGPAVSGGFVVAGVKALTLTNPNFGVAYQNVWSEMKDANGNTASGPSPYHISVRAMAVYADGAQSPWSNLVEVRTIGNR